MRKAKLYLIIFILFMSLPIMISAEVCENDNIVLKSISLNNKTDYVEEITPATTKKDEINLDIKMFETGDFIEYNLRVKNTSNDTFYLEKSFINIESDYIDYTLSYKDDSNLMKANTEKEVLLKIFYKNEVPKEKFALDKYSDKLSFKIDLSKKDSILNPKTGTKLLLLLLISITVIVGTIYTIKGKKKSMNVLLLIMSSLLMIPISTFAVCKNEIKINLNVDIMSYLVNPNYRYASSSYLLTTSGKLYNYDINRLNYNEEILATLDNLNANEVTTNVKHFDEYRNYYYTNDNKIYTLNNLELLLDNIKDIYNIGEPYAITKDNKLYKIENGTATFISENVDYVYNDGSSSIYYLIDLDGNIHQYKRINTGENNYDVLNKTIFENSNNEDITGIYMSFNYITFKMNNNDYYLYYLKDSDDIGLVKFNDLKYILKKDHYYANLGVKNNGNLVDLTNLSIELEEPIIMNTTSSSFIVDKNRKLYKTNKTLIDTGVTVKECVVYQLNGPYRYSACIDKNDFIHLDGSNKSSPFCTQTQYSCSETTRNIKVSQIGQYNSLLYVKTTGGEIYVWDNSHSYFAKTNVSESSINWLDDVISNFTSNHYNYYAKVDDYKNDLDKVSPTTNNIINYYGDNEPTNDINNSDFKLIKSDDGWKYTRLYSESGEK